MYLFTYFVIKHQFKTYYDFIKCHYSVSVTNSTSFDEKNKSKAITTFLGKKKYHVTEHKPNTYDQRVESDRNPQRELFRRQRVWTKAKDDPNE